MSTFSSNPRINLQGSKIHIHGAIIEEIEGLIRVYKDGYIERPQMIANVPCNTIQEVSVASKDIIINQHTNLWSRLYIPSYSFSGKFPVLLYFHGGGFCLGSASWSCYDEFLANLSWKAGCIIVSLNYRLAPEHRLPAAYEDGFNTLIWLKQQAWNDSPEHKWWLNYCNFNRLFLGGDSAGANIAYNVAIRLGSSTNINIIKPFCLRGVILVQPFFGGEEQSLFEKNVTTQLESNSALTVSASDTYWRLSLPVGANRDHPWCNPVAISANKLRNLNLPSTMVCVSEMDILKERNLEFCRVLASVGKKVEKVVYRGVGHAFQILHNSQFSEVRTQELMADIKSFINK
ncbi:hypothetical protein JCGZ_12972 [Jatropha curcas]|uniref:Alpha/beta hydrolase fold-3 domain-containing protein n=1 Tax=Jatropha curcas TaxID=180498 RepID=A0A067K9M8_JATCU|nr:probable carboxylesterase 17 [Jatropha curcas]KDP32941.1 hypothetical protein JCGZ_12972 [Jatropha curcas]